MCSDSEDIGRYGEDRGSGEHTHQDGGNDSQKANVEGDVLDAYKGMNGHAHHR